MIKGLINSLGFGRFIYNLKKTVIIRRNLFFKRGICVFPQLKRTTLLDRSILVFFFLYLKDFSFTRMKGYIMNITKYFIGLLLVGLLLISVNFAVSQDWPQWQGINRDGKSV